MISQNVQVIPGTLSIAITINVLRVPTPVSIPLQVDVTIRPGIPNFQSHESKASIDLTINPIPLPAKSTLIAMASALLSGKVASFYDEDRELKTVLNFGDDFQSLITNWAYDPNDRTGQSVILKLYNPLPDGVEEKRQVWIDRELSPTLIDNLSLFFTPDEAPKVYLRNRNTAIPVSGKAGASVNNVTMTKLLSADTFDVVKPSDPVLEEWFTDDINASELNVDYADYREFVFFGSAKGRLDAFVNKLTTIEELDSIITQQSSSLVQAGTYITGTLSYPAIKKYAEQRLDIIRSFDPYERFLYYESNKSYSSSLSTEDEQDQIYHNIDATWPKIGDVVAPVADATEWYGIQSSIAQEYDKQNPNFIGNNIPSYVQRDVESQEFLTFLNLVGHHFDKIKLYIDHMSHVYDRNSDPSYGMSPDLIWNVAQSFGVNLPNQYAIKNLVDYTIGSGSVSPKVYRNVAAETWKRILHNQIHMMKSKGTKNSLRALANSYGILPSVLQIRESSTPGPAYPDAAFETYEEQANALAFSGNQSILVPWSASIPSAKAVQARFVATQATRNVLFSADNIWSLVIEPTTGSYGVLSLYSDSSLIVSTSNLPLFDGEFFTVMVRKPSDSNSLELLVKRCIGDDIVYESVVNEPATTLWSQFNQGSTLYLGGNTSGSKFVGEVDEFRVWTEAIEDDVFDLQVKYPGLYAGNTETSARDDLPVRLSFNKPINVGLLGYVVNETPYTLSHALGITQLTATGFTSAPTYPYNMVVNVREVVRYSPNAGGGQFTTNKTIIADAPVLQYMAGTNIPVLHRDKSIVSMATKVEKGASDNIVGFYFSITDAINDSIIRSIGNIDLQNLIGDPADQNKDHYAALTELSELYWSTYASQYDPNRFVDFVEGLLEPLFKQAKQLIPVRAKLLNGIVHEPHILERNKVQWKPIEVTGGSLTRNSSTTQNLEANPVTSHPDIIHSEVSDVVIELLMNDTTEIEVISSLVTSSLTTSRHFSQSYSMNYFSSSIQLASTTKVADAAYLMLDDYTNFLAKQQELAALYDTTTYNAMLAVFQSPGSINIGRVIDNATTAVNAATDLDYVINTIEPYTDFLDIGSYTYFMLPSGTIGDIGYNTLRVNQNVLKDRGTWTTGTTYSRNDYVLLGVKEYVCTTHNLDFVSYLSPDTDPANWTVMKYTTEEVVIPKTALVVNDRITVTAFGTVGTNPPEYMPYHYKFTRDNRRGTLNRLHLGCTQTDSTTTDGKPAVEVFVSAGDILVVNDGGEPVQRTNDNSGPILDVE
jgi:hypothetical protein